MKLSKYIKGDQGIWGVIVLLSMISILVVYSSTGTLAFKKQGGNTEYFLIKHSLIVGFGILLIYITSSIRFTNFSRLAQIALITAVPLLLFTLARGANLNEASRWLEIPGINLTFQTSDFAKLALIMYLARILAIKQDEIKDFRSAFLPVVLPVILICGLILPANFSTAAVLFSTSLVIMFIGRVNLKYIFMLIGTGVVCLGLFIMLVMVFPKISNRVETWKARIENYSSGKSESNYQVEQAKIAIATGHWIGKGPGRSTQRNFLPHPYSDFIYAIIIEEYGLIGGLFVLFLYLILLYRSIRIAQKSSKVFGSLLAVGCAFSLVFQALINMAVAVNLFPVTGQPLPFMSMGGTSIWFTGISLGIILSVSRESEKQAAPEPGEEKLEGGEVAAA